MPEPDNAIILDGLAKKRNELLAERRTLFQQVDDISVRLKEIAAEIEHIRGTERLFGGIEEQAGKQAGAQTPAEAQPQAEPARAEEPKKKIKDLVLAMLKAAGPTGIKAADIRQFIETIHSLNIHEKTVGMTLFRLSKRGIARREGITWFFVPPDAEKKNPGGEAPGQLDDLLA